MAEYKHRLADAYDIRTREIGDVGKTNVPGLSQQTSSGSWLLINDYPNVTKDSGSAITDGAGFGGQFHEGLKECSDRDSDLLTTRIRNCIS